MLEINVTLLTEKLQKTLDAVTPLRTIPIPRKKATRCSDEISALKHQVNPLWHTDSIQTFYGMNIFPTKNLIMVYQANQRAK